MVAKHGEVMTREAAADMKYADAVVREALRIKGPVSIGVKYVFMGFSVFR